MCVERTLLSAAFDFDLDAAELIQLPHQEEGVGIAWSPARAFGATPVQAMESQ